MNASCFLPDSLINRQILQTSPNSARNDSTRGYALNPEYTELIKQYGSRGWDKQVIDFINNKETVRDLLNKDRTIIGNAQPDFTFYPDKFWAMMHTCTTSVFVLMVKTGHSRVL